MAGAVLPAPGDTPGPEAAATLLASLLCEVWIVGGGAAAAGRPVPRPEPRSELGDLVGALAASDAERVLVLGSEFGRVAPALLLALVAWPEADAVAPRSGDGPQPRCALYRPAALLPVARARLAEGARDLAKLLRCVETAYLEGADLAALGGLAAPAVRDVAPSPPAPKC